MLEVPNSNNNETYTCDSVSSDMTISAGDVVIYEACDEIILKPGFHAEATSTFTARIVGNCSAFVSEAATFRTHRVPELRPLSMEIFPNPASDFVTIDYQLDKETTAQIELYDATGRRLTAILPMQSQAKGKYQQQFNLGNLQEGMYFILLQTEREQISKTCLLYTSPSPRDATLSRMPSSA